MNDRRPVNASCFSTVIRLWPVLSLPKGPHLDALLAANHSRPIANLFRLVRGSQGFGW
jgi:hypothetical protein